MSFDSHLGVRDQLEAALLREHLPAAFCGIVDSLRVQGWVARARQHLERACARWPDHLVPFLHLARLLYSQRRFGAARDAARESHSREPNRQAAELLARCHLRLGDLGGQCRWWLEAQQLPPGERLEESQDVTVPLRQRCIVLEGGGAARSLLIDGEPRSLLDDAAVSSVLQRLDALKQVFDWPIGRLSAPEPQMQPVAALLAQAWGVPWGVEDQAGEFTLRLALTADALPVPRQPGFTFVLAAASADGLAGWEPDVLGAVTPRRPCWVSEGKLELGTPEHFEPELRGFVRWTAAYPPRSRLCALEGWQDRLARRAAPTASEVCARVAAGDLRWVDWLQELDLQATPAGREALLRALSHPAAGEDCRLLELALDNLPPKRVWQLGREVQLAVLRGRILTEDEIVPYRVFALEGDDEELREAALEGGLDPSCLSAKAAASLRLDVLDEADLLLRWLSPAECAVLIFTGPLPRGVALPAWEKAEPTPDLVELAALGLGFPDLRLQWVAARLLVRAGDRRALAFLLARPVPLTPSNLQLIGELDPALALGRALQLLETDPERALDYLRSVGSAAGLDACRRRARLPGADTCCVLYLQAFGAPEEEMLETLLTRDPFAVLPLLDRGRLEFLEVLQHQLGGEDGYWFARLVLEWGNPVGLALLTNDDLRDWQDDLKVGPAARALLQG